MRYANFEISRLHVGVYVLIYVCPLMHLPPNVTVLVGTKLSEELNYRMLRIYVHFKRGVARFVDCVVCCMKN